MVAESRGNDVGKSVLSRAVRYLRIACNLTQVDFAVRIGKAPTTVVRYETQRAPSGDVLYSLHKVAEKSGFPDLAAIFLRGWLLRDGAEIAEDDVVEVTKGNSVRVGDVLEGYAARPPGFATGLIEAFDIPPATMEEQDDEDKLLDGLRNLYRRPRNSHEEQLLMIVRIALQGHTPAMPKAVFERNRWQNATIPRESHQDERNNNPKTKAKRKR